MGWCKWYSVLLLWFFSGGLECAPGVLEFGQLSIEQMIPSILVLPVLIVYSNLVCAVKMLSPALWDLWGEWYSVLWVWFFSDGLECTPGGL